MALDWIQVDVGFSRTVAAVAAADMLGLDRLTFLGHMQELQVWAVQALPTGRFTPLDASGGRGSDASADEPRWAKALELGAFWTGEAGRFWDALLRAGILVREGDGVRLTTSDRYVQALEKRAREAKRKREARAKAKGGPSAGRPADVRPQMRRDEMRRDFPTAAAGVASPGASAGRPALAPLGPSADAPPDAKPVQRALPGAHLVPASSPRGKRRREGLDAGEGRPPGADTPFPPPEGSTGPAEAFFARCQALRRERWGVPADEMPKGWAAWYAAAVGALDGDERRLAGAWCRYLEDDWAATRKPTCPADAFQTVWKRHVSPLEPQAPVVAVPVDTSTDQGRAWQSCVDVLEQERKDYALEWVGKATPVNVVDGELVMRCPDSYFRDWVVEHYADMLDEVACSVGLEGIRWVVEDQPAAASA